MRDSESCGGATWTAAYPFGPSTWVHSFATDGQFHSNRLATTEPWIGRGWPPSRALAETQPDAAMVRAPRPATAARVLTARRRGRPGLVRAVKGS